MEITATMVKELRSRSGAGIMECKSALQETEGAVEDAVLFLRKKGLATADKKIGRQTAEGKIGFYIHPGSKIGVLLTLHCETDFVANTADFQELAKDIAMHIAAAKPRFAAREEVAEEILEKEREIYSHQAQATGKPENIIGKIVAGKMEKFYEENCVLEQAFVKDTNLTVGDLIKQKIALLGENINLGKFARFEI